MTNCLRVCLSRNILISPLFVEDNCVWYRLLGWHSFFHSLNMSPTVFRPPWFLMRILCIWCVTYLAVFKIFCLRLSKIDYHVSLCRSLWVYITYSLLSPRMWRSMLFIKFVEFRAIISSDIPSSFFPLFFFSETLFVYVYMLDCIHMSLKCCSFFFPIFSF